MLPTAVQQQRAQWTGTRRLLRLTCPSVLRLVRVGVRAADVADDCVTATFDDLLRRNGGPVWDRASFDRLQRAVAADLPETAEFVAALVKEILSSSDAIERRLRATTSVRLRAGVSDIGRQLARLTQPGFVTATGVGRLADVRRYVAGIERRLNKLEADPDRDELLTLRVQALERNYEFVRRALPAQRPTEELVAVRWMIEELRVSYFAQMLGTAVPVSDKRIRVALASIAS